MFIGIDPGIKGGIAVIYEGMDTYDAYVLPIMDYKVGNKVRHKINIEQYVVMIRDILEKCNGREQIVIGVEHVTAMPNQGVTSMFNFGYTFGTLMGVGYCFTRKISTISPRKWKTAVLEGSHDKAGAIGFVEKHYPNVNLIPRGKRIPHDGMADAMCIAHYLKITNPPN